MIELLPVVGLVPGATSCDAAACGKRKRYAIEWRCKLKTGCWSGLACAPRPRHVAASCALDRTRRRYVR